MYGRLHKKKSGQAATRMTERQKWNLTNFNFLKSHIAVCTVTKQLGKVPCPEPEEDDGPPSDADSISASAEADQPGPSSQATSRPSQVPKRKRQQTTTVDDALLKMVEKASGTQLFCQQVDELLRSSRNPCTVFSQWIAAETECLPDEIFRRFQTDVFTAVMRYRDIAQQPRRPQFLTAPTVMLQRTSTPTSYPLLPRHDSVPQPVTVASQLPTQVTTQVATQDWPQVPAYQQHDQYWPQAPAATYRTVVPELIRAERTPVLHHAT
uniref:uncharacterized protein isoform X1 n=1 Tax=Myxine glutinosa TaxID=7769 RepID=UPI00358E4F8D